MMKMSHKILMALGMAVMAASAQAQNTHPGERDPDGTWRFHMVQNGKVMTADDFSAWMAQRGLAIQNGRSVNTVHASYQPAMSMHSAQMTRGSVVPPQQALSQPVPSQQAHWQPAAHPITTAPERRPRLDDSGHLTGYDSSWDAGQYSTGGYSSGYSQGSPGSSTTLMSYDSGRDY